MGISKASFVKIPALLPASYSDSGYRTQIRRTPPSNTEVAFDIASLGSPTLVLLLPLPDRTAGKSFLKGP